jgi:hypothetical protein
MVNPCPDNHQNKKGGKSNLYKTPVAPWSAPLWYEQFGKIGKAELVFLGGAAGCVAARLTSQGLYPAASILARPPLQVPAAWRRSGTMSCRGISAQCWS